MQEQWMAWAKELQALAQAGLEYTTDAFDEERFKRIREISGEIMSVKTGLTMDVIEGVFINEKGYQTPKVDVRAAVFKEDKILMVKEQSDGCWSLPGGWADIGHTLSENIAKESLEEAGAIVKPKRVIAILDRNRHVVDACPYDIYKMFVECDYIKGKFEENTETDQAGFFTKNALPPLSEGRNTREQIEMCFIAHRQRVWETIMD